MENEMKFMKRSLGKFVGKLFFPCPLEHLSVRENVFREDIVLGGRRMEAVHSRSTKFLPNPLCIYIVLLSGNRQLVIVICEFLEWIRSVPAWVHSIPIIWISVSSNVQLRWLVIFFKVHGNFLFWLVESEQ